MQRLMKHELYDRYVKEVHPEWEYVRLEFISQEDAEFEWRKFLVWCQMIQSEKFLESTRRIESEWADANKTLNFHHKLIEE